MNEAELRPIDWASLWTSWLILAEDQSRDPEFLAKMKGLMIVYHLDDEKICAEGFVALQKAALVEGKLEELFLLAWMVDHGVGVEQDVRTALTLYLRAANKGHPDAQFNVGVMYDRADEGVVERDAVKAAHYYKLAVAQGVKDAQYSLAYLYADGDGVERDYNKAVYFYDLAVRQGDKDAMYNVGEIFERGVAGIPQDLRKAVEYFSLAGDVRCSNKMGLMYRAGTGVPRDTARAVQCYQVAAEYGSTVGRLAAQSLIYGGQL